MKGEDGQAAAGEEPQQTVFAPAQISIRSLTVNNNGAKTGIALPTANCKQVRDIALGEMGDMHTIELELDTPAGIKQLELPCPPAEPGKPEPIHSTMSLKHHDMPGEKEQ